MTSLVNTQNKSNTNQSTKNERERFWELDFVRGLCVFLMVIDHAIQLMYFSYNEKMWDIFDLYMSNPIRNFFHPVIRALFFLVCGVSCVLSRSNFKRGKQLLFVACLVTFVTLLLDTCGGFFSGVTIYFGVLHMLAIAILFYALLAGMSSHIPKIGKLIPALFGVFCIAIYYLFIQGKYGDDKFGFFPSIIGYKSWSFFSGDYSPLFPEMGFVLIGSLFGQFYKSKYRNALKPLDGLWNRPVCFLGKHALVIYVLQPVLISIVYLFI